MKFVHTKFKKTPLREAEKFHRSSTFQSLHSNAFNEYGFTPRVSAGKSRLRRGRRRVGARPCAIDRQLRWTRRDVSKHWLLRKGDVSNSAFTLYTLYKIEEKSKE
ncbi:hypothetical protein EVAR_44719_1 [Eumeta japonica]|uniref:Uncharacterized protein n=1 Tax=Eumeta variegata TaxID=151549 RepID=A0A4C1XK36_EUMVA|nr:hypothetical protein EVAR_44719_1 [Eumeta japonica]